MRLFRHLLLLLALLFFAAPRPALGVAVMEVDAKEGDGAGPVAAGNDPAPAHDGDLEDSEGVDDDEDLGGQEDGESAEGDEDDWEEESEDEDLEGVADQAADADELVPIRVGIGVGLVSRPFTLLGDDSTVGTSASFANLQIPVYIGSRLRIEPEFGYFHQSGGVGSGLAGFISKDSNLKITSVRALVGVQYALPITDSTTTYLGPKAGLQSRSITARLESRNMEGEIRAVDFWIGGAVGGEAFLTSHFSLGVELGFYYLSLGRTTVSAESIEVEEDKGDRQWILSTSGSFSARLYFL